MSSRQTTIPQSWLDAEAESGTFNDGRPLDRGSRSRVPSRDKLDGFSAGILSILVMVLSIVAWSWLQLSDTYDDPWPAVGVAVLIALAIRLGAGSVDSSSQAIMSSFAYLVVLVVTTGFVAWRDAITLYGDEIGVEALDAEITNRFFTDPLVVGAWIAGLVVAFGLPLLLSRR